METLKKIIGAAIAVVVVMTLMSTSISAQNIPSIAVFDNIGTVCEGGKLKISWTNLEYKDAHYFIVEKLDENWDYQLVDKVSAHPMEVIYSMTDKQPTEGENYYRITVVTLDEQKLQSDLMVADYFEPTPVIDFLAEVSNSMLARTLIEKSLKNSDLINPKYSSDQLALNRVMLTSQSINNVNRIADNSK